MVSLIGGAVAVVLGIIGLASWWVPFLLVLRGMVPAILILCGAVAVGAGFGSLKDKIKCSCSKKEEEKKEEEKTEEPAQEEKKES